MTLDIDIVAGQNLANLVFPSIAVSAKKCSSTNLGCFWFMTFWQMAPTTQTRYYLLSLAVSATHVDDAVPGIFWIYQNGW